MRMTRSIAFVGKPECLELQVDSQASFDMVLSEIREKMKQGGQRFFSGMSTVHVLGDFDPEQRKELRALLKEGYGFKKVLFQGGEKAIASLPSQMRRRNEEDAPAEDEAAEVVSEEAAVQMKEAEGRIEANIQETETTIEEVKNVTASPTEPTGKESQSTLFSSPRRRKKRRRMEIEAAIEEEFAAVIDAPPPQLGNLDRKSLSASRDELGFSMPLPAPPPPPVQEKPLVVAEEWGVLTQEPAQIDSDVQDVKEGDALTVFDTVRSGQSVVYDGDIIVLGDVNFGGELVATGNIVVLGILRGVAHAGCSGDSKATVTANVFAPQQLRIAEYVALAPEDNDIDVKALYPEQASIVDERIMIRPMGKKRGRDGKKSG